MYTRRKFFIQGTLATTAFLVSKPVKALTELTSPFTQVNECSSGITLMHTSGIHNLWYSDKTVFRQTRRIITSSKKQNSVLLDTGSDFGTKMDVGYECIQDIQNLGYDATLSHNEGSINIVKPFKIIKKGRIKIGIIGTFTQPGNLTGSSPDPVSSINTIAAQLKNNHHCNLIICLPNLDSTDKIHDIKLAEQTMFVDVIIRRQPEGSLHSPLIALNKNNEEVVINYTGHETILLGKIEIGFDKSGLKNHLNFNNILTT
jgi:hypothetical protein